MENSGDGKVINYKNANKLFGSSKSNVMCVDISRESRTKHEILRVASRATNDKQKRATSYRRYEKVTSSAVHFGSIGRTQANVILPWNIKKLNIHNFKTFIQK